MIIIVILIDNLLDHSIYTATLTLFKLCFLSPPTHKRNIWFLSCKMFHYVHQLISNCLSADAAEQVVYSRL